MWDSACTNCVHLQVYYFGNSQNFKELWISKMAAFQNLQFLPKFRKFPKWRNHLCMIPVRFQIIISKHIYGLFRCYKIFANFQKNIFLHKVPVFQRLMLNHLKRDPCKKTKHYFIVYAWYGLYWSFNSFTNLKKAATRPIFNRLLKNDICMIPVKF